jgi:thiamine-phosphate diphosphorylase
MSGAAVPHLYLVATRDLFDTDAAWLDAVERVALASVSLRQVRLALQVRLEATSQAASLAREALRRVRAVSDIPLWLNARAGVAGAGYDGTHLPERALPTGGEEMRGPWAASVHTLAACRQAAAAGATFVVFGALWKPQWKAAEPRGVDALQSLTRTCEIPVLAIGGITVERVPSCLRAGAAGVAVASGIFAAADLEQGLAAYVSALSRSLGRNGERRREA